MMEYKSEALALINILHQHKSRSVFINRRRNGITECHIELLYLKTKYKMHKTGLLLKLKQC